MDILIRGRFGLPPNPWKGLHMDTADVERVGLLARAAATDQAMVAIIGPRGGGKTHAVLHELRRTGAKVVRVQRLDRERAHMGDVVTALVEQLSDERVRHSGQARAGQVCRVLGQERRPVVLLVDDMHELHYQTLKGLKRLRELEWGSRRAPLLGIVLAGQRDRTASVPEVGLRTSVLALGGLSAREATAALQRAVGKAFEPAALSRIVEAAAGVWLDMQDMVDLALVKAAERGETKASPASVAAALQDVSQEGEPAAEPNAAVDDALARLEAAS